MNSIGENCNELKRDYDACFNSWFAEKFLHGNTNDSACAPLFRVYQQCVKEAIRDQKIDLKEIETDHLGTEREYQVPSEKSKDDNKKTKGSTSKS
ncbi:TP53-regulated inhibitor of apoptosis 1-like [Sitodiplosis mosellana]|uniref:TP53-regulated inhibitor of apoptosis 1-like n=1 Tax=Sitodiplosis mosellana TaxID=263140 RepID=UPI002444B1E1|nr:TP53-regulated inhibitor of apoptosis 1-like [Sitodiplosis mosellana]XP_055313916.1 TP53-regulated inhibitor of apoptosis 1-like [Sitodiplosis mosellana]XP_055313917.1 TP53-regulated inhibitor of apoptosis 1-like [Sitodiplosis mosellana]